MNYKHQQLKGVINYSKAMLKEAELGNWETVYSIEEQRSELIKRIYANSSTLDERENNKEQVQEILIINRQIEEVTSIARDKTKIKMGEINKGRQVVHAYAQNLG